MTINDIKIEALKLMFTNYNEDIHSVSELSNDDNYAAYIPSMNGAINRALARLYAKRVIRKRFIPLPTDFASCDDSKDIEEAISITLTEYEKDAIRDRIADENPHLTAEEIEAKAIVEINNEEAKLHVYIPVDAQLLIPYYIKADLYEEDEPAIAAQARNYFEAGLDDRWYDEEQEVVENVFRNGWLG